MNASLKSLIAHNEIGFEDIFEAYAQMCINTTRDITEDMILDEGVAGLVANGVNLSVESMTDHAVDWALVSAPEMLGDIVDAKEYPKNDNESWLEYVLRAAVMKRVKETDAFKIKFS